MLCLGVVSFWRGLVGFLVTFSKGDGRMVGGDSGEKEKAVREKNHITLKKVAVFFLDVGGWS